MSDVLDSHNESVYKSGRSSSAELISIIARIVTVTVICYEWCGEVFNKWARVISFVRPRRSKKPIKQRVGFRSCTLRQRSSTDFSLMAIMNWYMTWSYSIRKRGSKQDETLVTYCMRAMPRAKPIYKMIYANSTCIGLVWNGR